MNKHKFSAEVARQTRVGAVPDFSALSDRAYGDILVQADWTPLASEEDVVPIDVTVLGELAQRDVPAYVELFFHDAFLLFNIAVPGSFGGAITVTGGEFRVNDLSFDAAPFACGASSMSLAEVVAGFDPLAVDPAVPDGDRLVGFYRVLNPEKLKGARNAPFFSSSVDS